MLPIFCKIKELQANTAKETEFHTVQCEAEIISGEEIQSCRKEEFHVGFRFHPCSRKTCLKET